LAIRECAAASEAFATLKKAYDNRAESVRKIKETGKRYCISLIFRTT